MQVKVSMELSGHETIRQAQPDGMGLRFDIPQLLACVNGAFKDFVLALRARRARCRK